MRWSSGEEMKAEAFNLIENCLPYAYLSIGEEIQIELNNRLADMALMVNQFWKESIDRDYEPDANLSYVIEKYLTGVAGLFKAYYFIKQNKMSVAWDYLIDAQHDLAFGLRYQDNEYMANFALRLGELERNLFPPQVFTSSGTTFKSASCNICGNEYGSCGHVAGRLYMGSVCGKIINDFEADHMAIVDHPKDKCCRVYAYKNAGRYIDKLTSLPLEEDDDVTSIDHAEKVEDDGIMKIKMIAMRARVGGTIEKFERVPNSEQ